MTVALTDNAVVVGVLKASVADIKEGSYIGSGAMPQPDGTQKAVEVHVFAESMSSVDGPVITVKYKDGEKKIIVGPTVPIVRYEVGDKSELKPGAAINIAAATKKPDGTFSAARINVGRDGLVP